MSLPVVILVRTPGIRNVPLLHTRSFLWHKRTVLLSSGICQAAVQLPILEAQILLQVHVLAVTGAHIAAASCVEVAVQILLSCLQPESTYRYFLPPLKQSFMSHFTSSYAGPVSGLPTANAGPKCRGSEFLLLHLLFGWFPLQDSIR